MMPRAVCPQVLLLCFLMFAFVTPGCESAPPEISYPVEFRADVTTNIPLTPELEAAFADLEMEDASGRLVPLRQFLGKKPLVVIFTRGYLGTDGQEVSEACVVQATQIARQYEDFFNRGAMVIVVYPIPRAPDAELVDNYFQAIQRLDPGLTPTEIPFPILLDLKLLAVDKLQLRDHPAKPATFIFDQAGHLRFAYVGDADTDRPAMSVILKQLDQDQ